MTVPEKSADRATVAETAVVELTRRRVCSTCGVAFRSYRLGMMEPKREHREERRRSKKRRERKGKNRWIPEREKEKGMEVKSL